MEAAMADFYRSICGRGGNEAGRKDNSQRLPVRKPHCPSGAGDFPGEVGNGQAGDSRAEFASRRDAGEFFYVDEEGKRVMARYVRVTDLARRNEMPFAVLNTWNEFVEIRDQFPGWFPGHRERWEVTFSKQRRHVIGRDFSFVFFGAETEESALFHPRIPQRPE